MQVLEWSLRGVEMVLGSGNPMEKMNKFMGDGVFMEKGDLFDGVEDDGYLEDGSVE